MPTHVGRWALVFMIHKGPEHRGSGRISREAGERVSWSLGLKVNLKEQGQLLVPGPRSGVPLWRMAEARSQALPWRLLNPSGQSSPLFFLRSPQVTLPEWSWGVLLGGQIKYPYGRQLLSKWISLKRPALLAN